jgi:hypothetical protein
MSHGEREVALAKILLVPADVVYEGTERREGEGRAGAPVS